MTNPKLANPVLLGFLVELRKRVLWSLLVLTGIFLILSYFSNELYQALALPLLKNLPSGSYLIATQVIAPLWIPLKFALMIAFIVTIPFLIYQGWAFVAPALYQNERRIIWPLLLISIVLFYAGMAFAYLGIFPVLFRFLAHAAPEHILIAPDISQYLDFTLKMLLMFGLIFEVPIITTVLVLTKAISRERLITLRPYMIVTAFIIGMLIAPPDVFSQTLLAIPLWLLFEVGVFCARFL